MHVCIYIYYVYVFCLDHFIYIYDNTYKNKYSRFVNQDLVTPEYIYIKKIYI